MKTRLAIVCLALFATRGAVAPGTSPSGRAGGTSRIGPAIAFEARGSWFASRGRGYAVALTAEGIELFLDRPSSTSALIRMKLDGGSGEPRLEALEPLAGKVHSFVGSDPAQWRTNVATYGRVRYREAYAGIDLEVYGRDGTLEYDFVVAPGADPRTIGLKLEGAERIEIDRHGNLLLHAGGGTLRQNEPVLFQETPQGQRQVDGGYVLAGDQVVRFQVGEYDRSLPLVIDPVLSYSTYLGGSSFEFGGGVAVDGSGNAHVAGQTLSSDFPTLVPLQGSFGGDRDAVVSKFDASGNLLWSTYFGGSGRDIGFHVAIDPGGNVYVSGFTNSTNFPVANPVQASYSGSTDGFVFKLSPAGSSLLFSSYLGGAASDSAGSMVADAQGRLFVVGTTSSADFPTANAIQAARNGPSDGFLARLDTVTPSILLATYLGGGGQDGISDLALDFLGAVYLTGFTDSTDFPTTPLAFQTTAPGGPPASPFVLGGDGFVAKLDRTATSIVYASYLGGTEADRARSIAVDLLGQAYVTGDTVSPDFPITSGAYQSSYSGGPQGRAFYGGDAFVAKLNRFGSGLAYATYLGGGEEDMGGDLAVDLIGSAYVLGSTSSADLPTTANALQSAIGGGTCILNPTFSWPCRDIFVVKLNLFGSGAPFATYLGGGEDDFHAILARPPVLFEPPGQRTVFVSGTTCSVDFPTAGASQGSLGGACDTFFARLSQIP